MSITGSKSDTHSHLDTKAGRKRKGVHTVTSGEHRVADPNRQSPFGKIVLDDEAPKIEHPHNSILHLDE